MKKSVLSGRPETSFKRGRAAASQIREGKKEGKIYEVGWWTLGGDRIFQTHHVSHEKIKIGRLSTC